MRAHLMQEKGYELSQFLVGFVVSAINIMIQRW